MTSKFSQSLFVAVCLVAFGISVTGQENAPSIDASGSHNTVVVGNNNKIELSNIRAPLERQLIDVDSSGLKEPLRFAAEVESYKSIFDYDKHPVWRPQELKLTLLTTDQLNKRTLLLSCLKRYARSLVDLHRGTYRSQMDDEAAGMNLMSLNNSDSVGAIFPVSSEASVPVSDAVTALASYLVSRKSRSDLPRVIRTMDPRIGQLCSLLYADVAILRRQVSVEASLTALTFDQIIRHEGSQESPAARRGEILDMIHLIENQGAADESFARLQRTIAEFAADEHLLATKVSQPSLEHYLDALIITAANL